MSCYNMANILATIKLTCFCYVSNESCNVNISHCTQHDDLKFILWLATANVSLIHGS